MYISGQWLDTIGLKIFGNPVANAMHLWFHKLFLGHLCILRTTAVYCHNRGSKDISWIRRCIEMPHCVILALLGGITF